MAKKPLSSSASKRIKQRDKETLSKIVDLASSVSTSAFKGKEITVSIPTRAKSNTLWNRKKGILQMGNAAATRELFNLNQAKQFMQTMLHASTIKEFIDAEKTSSLRGVFYKAKHTVAGTKENTFDTQDESDPILEDLEVTLGALREELHVFAENRGAMVGNITVIDKGDEIDCRRMGSGGYAMPSIVEPDIIQFKKCEADFVLHVEKGTVWNRFNEDRFWEDNNCILTHGGGQPPRGVRRLLQRFSQEAKLPIICLLDCDPWGHYIYSVIKQGSISLAFESEPCDTNLKRVASLLRRIEELLERSLMLVTALSPKIGYDNASKVAKAAHKNGTTLREEAIKLGFVTADEFDRLVQPGQMTHPR